MSMTVNIYAAGENAGSDKPKREVAEVVQGIADRVIKEAEELAKAGYTVEPDSIRLAMEYGTYTVTMKASR